MDGIQRPELLPGCEVSARYRQPDKWVSGCLINLADGALPDNRRISSLDACGIRGGAALAAATFVVKAPGPESGDLQRIARASHIDVERPRFTSGDNILGLCYVAGTKGLPPGVRYRAVDALVSRFHDNVGYAEARHLLPKNDWDWLAEAVCEGWAVWTAQVFAGDESAPLKTRMRVGLALAEHNTPAGYVPETVEQLVVHPGGASSDRLGIAVAVARRDPTAGLDLLCYVAADPLIQAGHRMQAIELLDEASPARAQEMRALQIQLPSGREARDRRRESAERARREEAVRRERETPEAVVKRLDAEIENLLDNLRILDPDDGHGGRLDDHLAEADWQGVAQDIVDIFDVVRDEGIDTSVCLLETLARVRSGDEVEAVLEGSAPSDPDVEPIPQLTRTGLETFAKGQAERSWTVWREVTEEYGWDGDDRVDEVERKSEEITREVRGLILQKAGDHLRALAQRLMWETWPALRNAAEERRFSAARGHLAAARLLAEEAESAEVLWRDATAGGYYFDPLTMSWPREFWLVLEKWRHGTG